MGFGFPLIPENKGVGSQGHLNGICTLNVLSPGSTLTDFSLNGFFTDAAA
jgi:hypothetical protein